MWANIKAFGLKVLGWLKLPSVGLAGYAVSYIDNQAMGNAAFAAVKSLLGS